MPKSILIVDDERKFLSSLTRGLNTYSSNFKVVTASDGTKAIKILESMPIDLVVTDLKMPGMDGFGLMSYVSAEFPFIPVIVMSTFASSVIEEKVKIAGGLRILEKPLKFDVLVDAIFSALSNEKEVGSITGIGLGNFLQLIEMEGKSCVLVISSAAKEKGYFVFKAGDLLDALFGKLSGEEAAVEMLSIKDVWISIKDLPKKKVKKRIKNGIMPILMENARREDENEEIKRNSAVEIDLKESQLEEQFQDDKINPGVSDGQKKTVKKKSRALNPTEAVQTISLAKEAKLKGGDGDKLNDLEETIDLLIHDDKSKVKTESKKPKGIEAMSEITVILEDLKMADGFQAVGVFSPDGEMMGEVNPAGIKLKELGALANDVLLKAQKTTDLMGVGRGNMMHIEAPKANILVRCLNEATDYTADSAGRAHIHMVAIFDNECSLAMGKMKINSMIEKLAPLFR